MQAAAGMQVPEAEVSQRAAERCLQQGGESLQNGTRQVGVETGTTQFALHKPLVLGSRDRLLEGNLLEDAMETVPGVGTTGESAEGAVLVIAIPAGCFSRNGVEVVTGAGIHIASFFKTARVLTVDGRCCVVGNPGGIAAASPAAVEATGGDGATCKILRADARTPATRLRRGLGSMDADPGRR